jgi:predicted O-methyltransferase YrrM
MSVPICDRTLRPIGRVYRRVQLLVERGYRLLVGRAYRRIYLPRVDTIPDIRSRNPGFSAVRDAIRKAGTDSLSHFGNGYESEGGLSLQQNPDEFAALCAFLEERRPHRRYVEIGSASGGACVFLYRRLSFDQVVSLDDGGHPRAPEQRENFAQIPGIRQYVGDSHAPAAVSYLENELSGPIDVAFVDGDHSYAGVMQDIDLVRRFCRPGSLVILHDTVATPGVEKAWLKCARSDLFKPLAEYVGNERPLGIGIAEIR